MEQTSIKIDHSFWKELQDRIIGKALPHQWNALNDRLGDAPPSRSIHNLEVAAGRKPGKHEGHVFQDSDLAKFIEAASWSLTIRPDPELEEKLDAVIDLFGEAQEDSGYLNSAFMGDKSKDRFHNLQRWHELYVAGHIAEAAVTYYKATGKDRLLAISQKNIAHIRSIIGPGSGRMHGYPGHEELELALVRLYEATGLSEYLDFARYLIDERGKEPLYFTEENEMYGLSSPLDPVLTQSHKPVRQHQKAVGHAVRAGYLYAGMADIARIAGDESLQAACERLFDNISRQRMYITGGMGQTPKGEAFTFDYHLPNDTAYAESCAAIALALFARRMLKANPDSRYADVMERALYNGVLSGISLDGTKYFYVNPLEVWPEAVAGSPEHSRIRVERQPWYDCACCPSNIARTVLSMQTYICDAKENTVFIHLYAGCTISDGSLCLTMQTDYPWDGRVRISVAGSGSKTIGLRLPGWCTNPSVSVNGQQMDTSQNKNGYLCLKRIWRDGDEITLDFPMEPVFMSAHPSVRSDAGRTALMRGPLVYCLEQADNGPDLHKILVNPLSPVKAEKAPGLPESIVALTMPALRESVPEAELYRPYKNPVFEPVSLRFIPYYAWANRGPGEMMVWLRRISCNSAQKQ